LAADGKYYKYNIEINNIYYCPNNVIIDNFEVHEYNKDSFIVFDYFILDLKEKKILLYDKWIEDSFVKDLSDVKNIIVQKNGDCKEIIITLNTDEEIIITLDKEQRLIGYKNINLKVCGDDFLSYASSLTEFYAPRLEVCGDGFLSCAFKLSTIDVVSLRNCGAGFLRNVSNLTEIYVPNLELSGNYFLTDDSVTIKDYEIENGVIKLSDSFGKEGKNRWKN